MTKVIAWFSCGAASAIAAKLAIKKYGYIVEVVYMDTGSEHSDNKAKIEAVLFFNITQVRYVITLHLGYNRAKQSNELHT